ncbi:MAG: MATE family efflux transporter, partial [bacterium]
MNALQTVNAFIDRAFVGHLGRDSLAAVGVAGQLLFLFMSLAIALSIGTTAIVSRAYGAKNLGDAQKATRQSLLLGIVLGICAVVIALAVMPFYANQMGLEPAARDLAIQYLSISLLSLCPLFVINSIYGAFRGVGDTLRPMWIMILVNIVHIGGDALLINGNLGFPRLGLTGAAIALTSSAFMGLIGYLIIFNKYGIEGALKLEMPDFHWFKRILRISIPASMQMFLRVSSMMAFTGVLARSYPIDLRTAAVAALPIGLIAEGIAFMPGMGYSIAASALVGQNLGAKRPDRAEKLAWLSAWQCCWLMSVMSVIFFVFARNLAMWFINDQQVVEIAVSYLRIMAITEPLLAFALVLSGAHQGAGDTIRPTVVTGVNMWLIRFPMVYTWIIIFHGGASAAWWTMSLTQGIAGIVMIFVFRSGRWKTVKV